MTIAIALLTIVVFMVALSYSGLVGVATEAVHHARSASAVMRDAELDDHEKERAVRSTSLKLFGSFANIVVRGVAVFLISLIPAVIAEFAGLSTTSAVLEWLARPDVIVIVSVVLIAGYFAVKRLWRRT